METITRGPAAAVQIPDDYLGDGVYASFDGYSIVLDLRGQDSTTQIALEPSVMNALQRFRERAYSGVPPFPEGG